jgi:uncharacterized protein (DUF488 family)
MNTEEPRRRKRRVEDTPSSSRNLLLQVQQKVADHDPDLERVAGQDPAAFKIVTLGVYGSTEAGFFAALRAAQVDTFCDVRRRRGVRGSAYAFANRRRLEARLTEMGIRYLHCLDLAPSQAVRELQYAADRETRTAKRQRATLSEEFVNRYQEERLGTFDSRAFIRRLDPAARVVALFCVERAPAACHRSLLAERLQRDLGADVVHLMPE